MKSKSVVWSVVTTYLLLHISVSVSELMSTPSQRHVIPLTGRPYQETQDDRDEVSGILTIEFVTKNQPSHAGTNGVMPGVHRTFEASENRDSSVNKKTVYTRQDSAMPGVASGLRVAEMALKDIVINKTMNSTSAQPSKSTLLMHQVRTVRKDFIVRITYFIVSDDLPESEGRHLLPHRHHRRCLGHEHHQQRLRCVKHKSLEI